MTDSILTQAEIDKDPWMGDQRSKVTALLRAYEASQVKIAEMGEALRDCLIDLRSPFPAEAKAIAMLRMGDSSIEKAEKALAGIAPAVPAPPPSPPRTPMRLIDPVKEFGLPAIGMEDRSVKLSDPLDEAEVAKFREDDDHNCPRCGKEAECVSTHERDSSNDYWKCPKCKWTLHPAFP